MNTEEVWSGEFGSAYLKRNQVDWQARKPFWKMILDETGARSVYELGCNAGWNLSAINRLYPDVITTGVDINEDAITQAWTADLNVFHVEETDLITPQAELTFTAGVLIHIPPDDIMQTMMDLIDRSYDYVLSVEYEADKETEIEYRGQSGLLWKRPYGEMYKDLGLTPVDTGPAIGFDDCRYWLLRK